MDCLAHHLTASTDARGHILILLGASPSKSPNGIGSVDDRRARVETIVDRETIGQYDETHEMRVDQTFHLLGRNPLGWNRGGLSERVLKATHSLDIEGRVDCGPEGIACFERPPQRIDNDRFERSRWEAVRRSGHAITGLHDGSRDIIAVTNATLHRIGRRETLAGLVEDFASEKSAGAQSSGAGDPLRLEADLTEPFGMIEAARFRFVFEILEPRPRAFSWSSVG